MGLIGFLGLGRPRSSTPGGGTRRATTWLGRGGVVPAVVLAVLSACATPTPSSTPSCAHDTASMVGGALGLTLTGPTVETTGGSVVCGYARNGVEDTVVLRYRAGVTAAAFAAGRAQASAHMAPVSPVPGVGDEAYSFTVGSGLYQTATMVARRGGVEILITAPASLGSVQTLMARLLASP